MLTSALGIVTLALSFSFSPPEAFLADKFGHGIMNFANFFSLLLAAVWRLGRGDGPFPNRGLWLALAVIAAGIVVEMPQEVATAGSPRPDRRRARGRQRSVRRARGPLVRASPGWFLPG